MAQEKEINVNGRVFKIREMLAKEVDAIDFTDSKKSIKEQVKISTGMTDEEYDKLTFKERLIIQKEINALNGIGTDF